MSHAFETQLAASWPSSIWRDVRVVVAVSGGSDSVALVRALAALATPRSKMLVTAHFNHRLRAAADDDERFVVELCEELAVTCEIGRTRRPLNESGTGSVEEAARDARYEFLIETARRIGARYLVTAHTADDQAETVLHRILRGTGIRGLAGIPASRALAADITLQRPLLSFRRTQIQEYLRDGGHAFRDDESNRNLRFTRNRIRHELLPHLMAEYNPQVIEALLRLGSLAAETRTLLDELTIDARRSCVSRSGATLVVDCRAFANLSPILAREVMQSIWQEDAWPQQEMSYDRWSQLTDLAISGRGGDKVILPGHIVAEKQDEKLLLSRPVNSSD